MRGERTQEESPPYLLKVLLPNLDMNAGNKGSDIVPIADTIVAMIESAGIDAPIRPVCAHIVRTV